MKRTKKAIFRKVFISLSVVMASALIFATFWIKIHDEDIPAPTLLI